MKNTLLALLFLNFGLALSAQPKSTLGDPHPQPSIWWIGASKVLGLTNTSGDILKEGYNLTLGMRIPSESQFSFGMGLSFDLSPMPDFERILCRRNPNLCPTCVSSVSCPPFTFDPRKLYENTWIVTPILRGGITLKRTYPYASLGIGLRYQQGNIFESYEGIELSTKSAINSTLNYGLGISYKLTERLNLDIQFRGVTNFMNDITVTSHPQEPNTLIPNSESYDAGTSTNGLLSLGAEFTF